MDVVKLVSDAFLVAIIESVKRDDPDESIEWIESVAKNLGEREGPGLEGDPRGKVNCLHICPFANMLQKFTNEYGGMPEEFLELLNSERVQESFAASNIFCIFHHTLRAKRAELAGKEAFHLASDANVEGKAVYNQEAIEEAGLTKVEIDELLTKSVCIFRFK